MAAVHDHLGLDNRHDALLLAQRRVAGQCMSIDVQTVHAGRIFIDIDHGAPFGETGTCLAILDQAVTQTIQPLGHQLTVGARQRLGALVDLDARNDALGRQQLGERHAVGVFLEQGFLVQDHATDVLFHARCREQHVAVGPTGLLGGLDADRIKALLDRGRAFIRRENAATGFNQSARGGAEDLKIHAV